jgi:hypothetical protein
MQHNMVCRQKENAHEKGLTHSTVLFSPKAVNVVLKSAGLLTFLTPTAFPCASIATVAKMVRAVSTNGGKDLQLRVQFRIYTGFPFHLE